jgi:hypothetical protein
MPPDPLAVFGEGRVFLFGKLPICCKDTEVIV